MAHTVSAAFFLQMQLSRCFVEGGGGADGVAWTGRV
jgi:hypothetical protein